MTESVFHHQVWRFCCSNNQNNVVKISKLLFTLGIGWRYSFNLCLPKKKIYAEPSEEAQCIFDRSIAKRVYKPTLIN